MRLASIDVGTNSTRLLVADAEDSRILAQRAREMVITRLGMGVDRTRRFDPGALARTLEVIGDYAAACRAHAVQAVRVAATSATRDAANRQEFIDGVRALLGVEPEVLSGSEEAAASFLGATWDLPVEAPTRTLVFDIGGGSTEFIVGTVPADGSAPLALSVDIGSVRLTERHIAHDPPTAAEVAAVEADARAELAEAARRLGDEPVGLVVGVAGTVTTVTALSLGLDAYDPERVHRARLDAGQVRATAARLCAMTVADKAALPVMPPGREDVIAAGALILESIYEAFGLAHIMVSETDILDGLLLGLAARLHA
jgi:exopolyphosphatase / guanosine-5'-triphosphate,3'-diphosphate pyrophosphatase